MSDAASDPSSLSVMDCVCCRGPIRNPRDKGPFHSRCLLAHAERVRERAEDAREAARRARAHANAAQEAFRALAEPEVT